jgi:hypothetical protein
LDFTGETIMNNPARQNYTYDLLWLSIGLFPLLLIALLLPLTPSDYWWYLRLGHDVLSLGRVPSVDTYSYTQLGTAVINQPWLSAVIFWVAYNDGGLNLTFFLRAICVGATFGLLWSWMRQLGAGPRLASLLIIVAGLASSNNWAFRPQIFSYPLFALTILILWKWQKEERSGWYLWMLPVIGLLWANLHESFLLIFILGGAALVFGKKRKILAIVLAVTFVATLITPYDLSLWASLVRSYISNSSWDVSTEWLPPTNQGWQMNLFFGWVLLFIPLAALSQRRMSLLEWVWLLGLLWMSFSGIRYVIWGVFVLGVFSAYLLADWDVRWVDQPANIRIGQPLVNYIIAIALLWIPFIALPGIRSQMGVKNSPAISVDTPVQATEWLAEHPELSGPLWSDLGFSSYLIFALPTRSVWIDTRFGMVYTPLEFQRYRVVATAEPGWQGILDRWEINLLMLSMNGEPLLIQTLANQPEWCKVYSDPIAAIYSRIAVGQSCP